jgi:hypothetical protein
MEALHPGSGLDAQKENLDANLGGGALSSKGTLRRSISCVCASAADTGGRRITMSLDHEGNKRSFGAAFSAGGVLKPSGTPNTKHAAFAVHSDVKPSKKGLKESAKKNRCMNGTWCVSRYGFVLTDSNSCVDEKGACWAIFRTAM